MDRPSTAAELIGRRSRETRTDSGDGDSDWNCDCRERRLRGEVDRTVDGGGEAMRGGCCPPLD